jgi:hypothetical protein
LGRLAWSREPGFSNCSTGRLLRQIGLVTAIGAAPFIRAQLHLENDQHPAFSVIAAHKAEMVTDLADILREVGLPNPVQVAGAVLLLFDGAAIHAEIAGNGDPFSAGSVPGRRSSHRHWNEQAHILT